MGRNEIALVVLSLIVLGLSLFVNGYVLFVSAVPVPASPDKIQFTTLTELEVFIEQFAANHSYINETEAIEQNTSEYMCLNYSYDMIEDLKEMGFAATLMRGRDPNSTMGHAWVRITLDIEPMIGMVALNYEDTYSQDQWQEYCADWQRVWLN